MFSSLRFKRTLSHIIHAQGPLSKFLSWGGGGGAKEECVKEIFLGGGGFACGFLFNFSNVTENAIITINY